MLTFKRISLAALISLALLAVVGCPQHKSIAVIQRDPAYYATREGAVEGRVTHSFGALGTGIYEIDDGTGKLWVFAESTGVPSAFSFTQAARESSRLQTAMNIGSASLRNLGTEGKIAWSTLRR